MFPYVELRTTEKKTARSGGVGDADKLRAYASAPRLDPFGIEASHVAPEAIGDGAERNRL
jgi:hypothetical protein